MWLVKQRLIFCLVIPYLATACSDSGVTFLSTHGDEEHWRYEEQTCASLSSSPYLYALNRNVAFISATLNNTRPHSYRPMFIRTADGGSSWKEVMQPSYGRKVIDVHFNNDTDGWALVMWSVEGPGDVTIFRTRNAGASWELMSEIPKSYSDGQPTDVYFHDADHGFVEMAYGAPPIEGQDVEYWELLETQDGGATWALAKKMPLDDYRQEIKKTLYASKVQKDDDVGTDGTRWALEMDWPNYILRIRRFSEAEKQMKLVQTIKEPFLVNDGIITSMGPRASIDDERCRTHPRRH